jgi:plastocyanin
MSRSSCGVVLVAAILAIAVPSAGGGGRARGAAGGTLRGRVTVVHPLTASHPVAPGAAPIPAEVRREAVVFFEGVPPDAGRPSAVRARLRQVNETFVPHLLAVTTGSTVDFPNDDRTYHNVFSLSKTKQFDLGRYAAGKSKAVVFDKPGIVRVFCDIHSHMNAFILVFSHRYFAVTDPDGRYRIDQVPPGTYQVTAWYEGIAKQTERVTITDGAAADLDFSLR